MNTHERIFGHIPAPQNIRGRALARGGIVFLTFLLTAACAKGGGTPPTASAPAVIPPAAQTKVMDFYFGLGFVCWVSPATDALGHDGLWCWAPDPLALTDGNAAAAGLTSTTPALLAIAAPSTMFRPVLSDHDIQFQFLAGGIVHVQGTASGNGNTSNAPTTCDITASDSVHCAGFGVPDLTFAGLSF